jgi:HAD superfamily hydrolase (TIGR01509 family)
MSKIRAVLLDIDGTLVDSNDAHARAWQQALVRHGQQVPFEELRELIGKGGDKLLAETVGIDKDTPAGQAIDQQRAQLFLREHLPRLRPLPGARELILRLRSEGLRLVVATSAKSVEMNALLDLCGVRHYMDAHTSSDEAERSKPDPDIIQAALDKAAVPANAALMIGDTPYDVEAAARAGVGTVALRSGGWGDDALAGARAIYDHAAQLVTHFETSPFMRGAHASG